MRDGITITEKLVDPSMEILCLRKVPVKPNYSFVDF